MIAGQKSMMQRIGLTLCRTPWQRRLFSALATRTSSHTDVGAPDEIMTDNIDASSSLSLSSSTLTSMNKTPLAREIRERLQNWNGTFTVTALANIISTCARDGDPRTALAMYQVGLAHIDFDQDGRLGAYLVGKLLEVDAVADPLEGMTALEAAIDLIKVHQDRHSIKIGDNSEKERLYKATTTMVIERIMNRASVRLWERLDQPYQTVAMLEEAIIKIYLRSLQWSSLIKLFLLAQNREWRIREEVWREVFEVVLQPDPGERLQLTRYAQRETSYNFDALKELLREMRANKVNLTPLALDALETVMNSTMIPKDFLDFLKILQ